MEISLSFSAHPNVPCPYENSPQANLPPEHNREDLMDFAETMFGHLKRQKDDNQRNQATAGRIFVEVTTIGGSILALVAW